MYVLDLGDPSPSSLIRKHTLFSNHLPPSWVLYMNDPEVDPATSSLLLETIVNGLSQGTPSLMKKGFLENLQHQFKIYN